MPRKTKRQYPSNQRRTVVYYPKRKVVKSIVTITDPPGNVDTFAKVMAEHMGAKLIIRDE